MTRDQVRSVPCPLPACAAGAGERCASVSHPGRRWLLWAVHRERLWRAQALLQPADFQVRWRDRCE